MVRKSVAIIRMERQAGRRQSKYLMFGWPGPFFLGLLFFKLLIVKEENKFQS